MKDFKAISKTGYGKIKSGLGFKNEFAKFFKEQDEDYYSQIFNSKPLIIEDFIRFLESKNDINTALEIGCSTGIFPIKFNSLFTNTRYTGIDISQKSIDYCKKHSNFEFFYGDFLKMVFNQKFDLVFSIDVIDHVYDIDLFIKKIISLTEKYAYINSYRGYFPSLERHKMSWNDDHGVFYNNISKKQIEKTLIENGLTTNEFTVYSQKRDLQSQQPQTVIKISKKYIK